MTMDVALMVYSLGGGGVERMRCHLAGALQERGYTTSIVVARSDGRHGAYRSHVPTGVKFVDLGARSWAAWLAALTDFLKDEKPSVLLAAMETAGIMALWARRRASVATRIVVSSHVEISRHMQVEPKRLKRLAIPYLVRWLYRSADGIVAVSAGVADNLASFARLPHERISVIYNPVVTNELWEASKEEILDQWGTNDCCPIVLGAGRLNAQKDFRTLLKAFSVVSKQRSARLIILGEGEERFYLEAMTRELGLEALVQMPGFVTNPFAYMARASAFVLSSAWEGLPGALVQALACGCPVVSTDCPSGPREILKDGKYGPLVSVGDHEALAEAILATLDDPPDADMLRARALDFHVDKIIEKYIAIMGLA